MIVVLAGCFGIPLNERRMEKRDRYYQYAGTPVESFTHLGPFHSWAPIHKDELVVWTKLNDAYLIKVEPTCDDILFADRIIITQTANTVSQKFDFVKVDHWKCRIESIRPVDYLQMKKDKRRESVETKASAKGK